MVVAAGFGANVFTAGGVATGAATGAATTGFSLAAGATTGASGATVGAAAAGFDFAAGGTILVAGAGDFVALDVVFLIAVMVKGGV